MIADQIFIESSVERIDVSTTVDAQSAARAARRNYYPPR
jgi:hypothetical protein